MTLLFIVCLVGLGFLLLLDRGETCGQHEIVEVIDCGEIGCAYKLDNGGFDAGPLGLQPGDELEVCRRDRSEGK
jgi:hypothetical protein